MLLLSLLQWWFIFETLKLRCHQVVTEGITPLSNPHSPFLWFRGDAPWRCLVWSALATLTRLQCMPCTLPSSDFQQYILQQNRLCCSHRVGNGPLPVNWQALLPPLHRGGCVHQNISALRSQWSSITYWCAVLQEETESPYCHCYRVSVSEGTFNFRNLVLSCNF